MHVDVLTGGLCLGLDDAREDHRLSCRLHAETSRWACSKRCKNDERVGLSRRLRCGASLHGSWSAKEPSLEVGHVLDVFACAAHLPCTRRCRNSQGAPPPVWVFACLCRVVAVPLCVAVSLRVCGAASLHLCVCLCVCGCVSVRPLCGKMVWLAASMKKERPSSKLRKDSEPKGCHVKQMLIFAQGVG